MTDQANTTTVLAPIGLCEVYGRALMAMDPRPRLKRFGVVNGGRRMLGDRTPRPALNLKIIEKDANL